MIPNDVATFGDMLLPLIEKVNQRIAKFLVSRVRLQSTDKGDGQLQTELDLDLEKLIYNFLKQRFPDDAIISEENNPNDAYIGGNTWVVDPLDGTQNCAMGTPMYGIALVRIQNNCPTIGAIYLPEGWLQGGLFIAAKGQGAWEYYKNRNLYKITVSNQTNLAQGSLLIEGPSKKALTHYAVQKLIEATQRSRINLSATWSTILIASGGLQTRGADILAAVHNKLWDNLPMCLFIEEAGGIVTDFEGNPWSLENYTNIICCNSILHDQAVKLICTN